MFRIDRKYISNRFAFYSVGFLTLALIMMRHEIPDKYSFICIGGIWICFLVWFYVFLKVVNDELKKMKKKEKDDERDKINKIMEQISEKENEFNAAHTYDWSVLSGDVLKEIIEEIPSSEFNPEFTYDWSVLDEFTYDWSVLSDDLLKEIIDEIPSRGLGKKVKKKNNVQN